MAGNVLVTGGAKRIGHAIINAGGDRASVLQGDLANMAAMDGLIANAKVALGPITFFINKASVFEINSVTNFGWKVWDRHFALHVKASALFAKNFVAALPESIEDLIVNTINQRVFKPTPQYFHYSLAKPELWEATKTMAHALAPRIRVNAIDPDPTLPSSRQDDAAFGAQIDGLILNQRPALAEFGVTISYLWQARSVTGQIIALDGSQHLARQTPDVTGMVK